MYGPGYPQYRPPPPPPPRPPGLSPLAIVLIVVAAVFVLGAGACVVLGSLIALGASAEPSSADPAATSTATSAPNVAPTTTNAPAPTDTATAAEDDEPPAPPTPTAAATATGAATNGSTGGTKWFCNATGWVRVCGFANVCNNQMVSGMGVGSDRYMAMTMAKNACENMARAKGGSTVCSVSCSVSTK